MDGQPRGPLTRSTAHRLGEIVGGHHGVYVAARLRDVEQPVQRVDELGGTDWQELRLGIVGKLFEAVGPPRLLVEFRLQRQ